MFMGAPVPSKRADAVDHSAMLTMAYFHPWTLRADDEEGVAVPFAGRLRASEESWDTALRTWLDGNVISCESVRYISNFLSVYRVRPRDPNEDARSDEDFSDEDLVLNEDMLEQAMTTRVGGKEKNTTKTLRMQLMEKQHTKRILERQWSWRHISGQPLTCAIAKTALIVLSSLVVLIKY